MTEPSRAEPRDVYGAYFHPASPMWCTRCGIHWATTSQPLCPTCLDDRAREIREAS